MQLEARFLAPMHGVAARTAGVEARAQGRQRRLGFGAAQCLLRERKPQQQRIDALFVFDERNDVGSALLFEQPIAVRADRVEIARIGSERCPEMLSAAASPCRCAISPSSDSIQARTSAGASGIAASERSSAAFADCALPVTASMPAVHATTYRSGCEPLHSRAVGARLIVFSLHCLYSRAHEDRASVTRLASR